ncbi:unnamed protein product [Rotaria sp. Silwood2]|nr:unnamed protein product [Rotaria sp. Silwood2]
MKELAFDQLKWYKQSVNQSITQYYDKIIELCMRIDPNMPDSLKLQYLIAGVKESSKLHIALHDPQTSESFLLYARKVEDTLSFTNSTYEPNQNDDYSNVAAMQQVSTPPNTFFRQCKSNKNNYVKNSQAHTYQLHHNDVPSNDKVTYSNRSRYGSQKSTLLICYNCGTPGHYSRDCTLNKQTMKVMIDTGANRTFISSKALHSTNGKQFINKIQRCVFLADGHTSIFVYGEVKLYIMMGDIQASIGALIVKQLCTDCILGMDFINKYKLIINTEDQTVSIRDNTKRTTLQVDINSHSVRFPTRLINNIRIPPKRTISVPVSINLLSAKLVDGHVSKLIQHITNSEQHEKVKFVLSQNAKLFDTSKPTVARTLKPHEIKTLDHPPPTSKPYYSTPLKQEAMYEITQELLYFGLIRPSYSPYAAPALLVAKHDGTWRMVVDYKKINNITIKDNHPLPNMEQAIQVLGGGYKFFSKLDMKSGFWQILIKQEDKYKTAFITPDGLYEWNVLAQGLKNCPPLFQRVMTDILSPCRQFALNILMKCSIFQHHIDYLSHTISAHGVKPIDEKIQAIIKLREPKTLAEAKKFLDALSWYRKFIPQFATIAAPIHSITNLTKPNRKTFLWGDSQKQAFLQLKQLLVNAPLFLNFPNDNHPVILTTDASKVGIGGTLQQIIDGETKNLYYHSQVTSSTQRGCDPIELEALAIWLCFQRMRSYLLGRSIIIYTDHFPLCNMMNSSAKNRQVDRQHNCLADYLSRYPIQYHEELFDEDYGINMFFAGEPPYAVSVSDVKLSIISAVVTRTQTKRILQQQSTLDIPSMADKNDPKSFTKIPIHYEESRDSVYPFTCNNFDIGQVKAEQAKDPAIQKKIKEIHSNTINNSYILHDGLLYKLMSMNSNNKTKLKLLYLPSSMIDTLLKAYHADPLAGHFGIKRTYLKLKYKFWWPSMMQSIITYIKSCLPYQQHNISRIKKPGQLYPIETPDGPFQLIGIDFCGPFKRTPRDNQYVLCITDYFTRGINAIALPDCSAQTTAQTIFNEYICRYGVPKSILSDQGTHFNNQLMDSMAKLIGYNNIYSTVYHPQSNGMVKRFNATFVPQLAKLHDHENNNWDEYLSPVIFAYNMSFINRLIIILN